MTIQRTLLEFIDRRRRRTIGNIMKPFEHDILPVLQNALGPQEARQAIDDFRHDVVAAVSDFARIMEDVLDSALGDSGVLLNDHYLDRLEAVVGSLESLNGNGNGRHHHQET